MFANERNNKEIVNAKAKNIELDNRQNENFVCNLIYLNFKNHGLMS